MDRSAGFNSKKRMRQYGRGRGLSHLNHDSDASKTQNVCNETTARENPIQGWDFHVFFLLFDISSSNLRF